MKPLIFWSILAMLLMIGCPWLAATFAGSAGMAVCLLLFFGVNPIFSAVCGLFLAGAWLFFAMGETAFLLYCVCYLMIGMIAMLMRSFLKGRRA